MCQNNLFRLGIIAVVLNGWAVFSYKERMIINKVIY